MSIYKYKTELQAGRLSETDFYTRTCNGGSTIIIESDLDKIFKSCYCFYMVSETTKTVH